MMTQADLRRWAGQLRALPETVRAELSTDDDTLRRRPAAGEWCAIEVVGHLVDKMRVWRTRAERVAAEERPFLPGFDQDAAVRDGDYQHAEREALLGRLAEACERFARVVEQLPEPTLGRVGVQDERGPITLREFIEAPLDSLSEHLAQLRRTLE
jgi:hypothetical protein